MMKAEFEKLAGIMVSSDEYEQIETVYMWHPLIDNAKGKEQIVQFWNLGVIRDMFPRAKRLSEIDAQKREVVKLTDEENKRYEAAVRELAIEHNNNLLELQKRLNYLCDKEQEFR